MDPKPDFGELIDHYLTQLDRPGRWLALQLAVDPATVTRWRNGPTRPKDAELVGRIADILCVPSREREAFFDAAGYLYGGETPTPTPYLNGTAAPPPLSTESEFLPLGASQSKEQSVEPAESADSMPDTDETQWPATKWQPSQRDLILIGLGIVATMIVASIMALHSSQSPAASNVRKFAIGEWENLSPDGSPFEKLLTRETRRILYQKLSVAEGLEGVFWDSSPTTPEAKGIFDLWIEGAYKKIDEVELSAAIFEGPEKIFVQSVAVQGHVDKRRSGVEICVLDIQTQLAKKILAALNLEIDAAVAETIQNTPTASCEALTLNNDAVILASQGNYQSARIKLNRALDIDPAYADAYGNLGWVRRRQGEHEQALSAYRKATELQPTHPLYWFNLGLAYEEVGDLNAAIEAYQHATKLDSTYTKAFNNLGYTLLLMGHLDNAAEQIQAGLALNPRAAYLHKNMGRIYLAQEKPLEAAEELQQAVDLFTDGVYAEAYYYLMQTYVSLAEPVNVCNAWGTYMEVADLDDSERKNSADEIGQTFQCAE